MICKHFVAGKQMCGSHDPDRKKKDFCLSAKEILL